MATLMLLKGVHVVRMKFSVMDSDRTSQSPTSKTTQKTKLCHPEIILGNAKRGSRNENSHDSCYGLNVTKFIHIFKKFQLYI